MKRWMDWIVYPGIMVVVLVLGFTAREMLGESLRMLGSPVYPGGEVLEEVPEEFQQWLDDAPVSCGYTVQGVQTVFQYCTWHDQARNRLYFSFINEGTEELFLHSNLFPDFFGVRHLQLAAGGGWYARVNSVDSVVFTHDFMLLEGSRCPRFFDSSVRFDGFPMGLYVPSP